LSEADYDDVLDFERSSRFSERQKAALAYTSMLVWTPDGVDDALWERLREHFSEEEIVELGSFVCVTFGQQRVIKTWAVGHGEFLADTAGGLKI
jgi:alkylhydroperoxidase family enzyme